MTERAQEILLVEDNVNDVELALRALRPRELVDEVHVAHDGAEALEFFADREAQVMAGTGVMPTLVILDLKLPKVDGIQVLRQVKSNPITQPIPVVILTSSSYDRDLLTCYRLGANSYIQKPVNFEAFRETVKQLALYWLRTNVVPPAAALGSTKP